MKVLIWTYNMWHTIKMSTMFNFKLLLHQNAKKSLWFIAMFDCFMLHNILIETLTSSSYLHSSLFSKVVWLFPVTCGYYVSVYKQNDLLLRVACFKFRKCLNEHKVMFKKQRIVRCLFDHCLSCPNWIKLHLENI